MNEYAVSHVVHLAGQPLPQVALKAPTHTFEANIASAWSVLDAARQYAGVHAVIMLSTSKVYSVSQQPSGITKHSELDARDMLDAYGASKRCAEVLAESYRVSFGVPTVSLRLANTYGPADPHRARLVPMAIDRALSGNALHVHGDGQQPLDLLYIDDAVDGILLALENAERLTQPAYNLGSSQVVTVQEVVDAVRRVAPQPLNVSYGSAPPHPTAVLDITRFEHAVGYCPATSLETGIARTLEMDGYIQRHRAWVG
jgi:nucleoside-diphosphate-sugar epimerase